MEDGDVEMGGAKSVLVSERVRMLERAPAQQHGDKPASEITTGVSIQERRALLERNEKRDEQRPSPSSSSRRTQSTSLNRLRSRKTITTCGACGGSLYENESETARGVVYHKSCLRCASCGRSLASVPFGKLAEDDDLLYCDENPLSRSGRSCLEKLREAGSHATAEREAKDQRLSDADKESVGLAKLRAVDLIGDDLDKIIQQMQPTCAICGYPFIASDKLVMQGMVKYHEACCYSGTAAVKRDVAISPKRALDEAPKDLLIKLKGTQQAAKTMTFFAIRRQESEGESLEAVDYLLDPASRAPNYRKADAATLVGATVRVLGTTGADLAPPTSASFSERNTLVAEFSWQGNALDWSIRATFSYVDNAVAFHSAKLSVVKLDDLNRQRSAQAKLLHPPPTFPSSK